jgi:PIN domain nuclease of toxin-antitoxin system
LRLLLDTSTLIWWANDSASLSRAARTAITRAEIVFVSAITAM